jgi:hypothetical protein
MAVAAEAGDALLAQRRKAFFERAVPDFISGAKKAGYPTRNCCE